MKKLLSFLFIISAGISYAQDNDYTMYKTLTIEPDNKNISKFGANLRYHNETYHSTGPYSATVWSIASGPDVGKYVWAVGPLKYKDINVQLGEEHDKHWNNKVMPFIADLGSLEYWKKIDNLSNNIEPQTSKVFISTYKISKGQSHRVIEYFTLVKKVMEDINKDNPWLVFANEFWQGNMGRHYFAISGFEDWSWLATHEENFKNKLIELNGENAWGEFLTMKSEIFEDSYDQIWIRLPGLSWVE